ncbi:DNA -binding domain-containing protein [Mesorhizobium sp. P5_C1]
MAIALYGFNRVAADPWKTSALRDAVIGLVEGATAMIGGGYLQILRHRRRP